MQAIGIFQMAMWYGRENERYYAEFSVFGHEFVVHEAFLGMDQEDFRVSHKATGFAIPKKFPSIDVAILECKRFIEEKGADSLERTLHKTRFVPGYEPEKPIPAHYYCDMCTAEWLPSEHPACECECAPQSHYADYDQKEHLHSEIGESVECSGIGR